MKTSVASSIREAGLQASWRRRTGDAGLDLHWSLRAPQSRSQSFIPYHGRLKALLGKPASQVRTKASNLSVAE
jgi:hypothetical protein